MINLLGYIASVFTVMSFLMKDVKKLRMINLLACSMFVVYGVVKEDYPIVLVNLIVASINIFYIFKK